MRLFDDQPREPLGDDVWDANAAGEAIREADARIAAWARDLPLLAKPASSRGARDR